MNIAIGAFLITLLFLPSLAFRIAINRQNNFRELLSSVGLGDLLWYFSLISICTHLLIILLLQLLGITINFQLIFSIVNLKSDFIISNSQFQKDILYYISYNLLSLIIGFLFGVISLYFERKNKLLTYYLGIDNNWYELLEGKIVNGKQTEFDFIYLDVLTETKEKTIIYSGCLFDYYFKSKSTSLSSIVLTDVTRKDFRKDESVDKSIGGIETKNISSYTGRETNVEGKYFVIASENIININIRFIVLK